MIAGVITCDRASTDYSVACLLDTPQFIFQLHKHGFGKEKCVNIRVSVHGSVDGNG